MSEHNGSTLSAPGSQTANNDADYLDGQLLELSDMLQERNLKGQFASYATDGERTKHHDATTVTNPAFPERGSMRIEKEGWVTWEYTGSMDDDGIRNLADEAAAALWAFGVPGQSETAVTTDDGNRARLCGTCRQQLVFLNTHWGSKYIFSAPQAPTEQWTATATFSQCHRIEAPSATELLKEIHNHYQANRPKTVRCDSF